MARSDSGTRGGHRSAVAGGRAKRNRAHPANATSTAGRIKKKRRANKDDGAATPAASASLMACSPPSTPARGGSTPCGSRLLALSIPRRRTVTAVSDSPVGGRIMTPTSAVSPTLSSSAPPVMRAAPHSGLALFNVRYAV